MINHPLAAPTLIRWIKSCETFEQLSKMEAFISRQITPGTATWTALQNEMQLHRISLQCMSKPKLRYVQKKYSLHPFNLPA